RLALSRARAGDAHGPQQLRSSGSGDRRRPRGRPRPDVRALDRAARIDPLVGAHAARRGDGQPDRGHQAREWWLGRARRARASHAARAARTGGGMK
ncbi:hypothetical protein CON20_27445, partial [Priestia megaterium]